MTGATARPRRHRAGVARALVAGLVSATLVVGTALRASTTLASWTDVEHVHATVGTGALDCGAETGFTTRSESRFLSGSVLGTNLDSLAALRGMTLSRAAGTTAVPNPVTALDLGSGDGDPTLDTFANPLAVTAVGPLLGLDLTGLAVGLPVGSAGALNQYTQVSSTGRASAASGLVSNSGGVLVSGQTPSAGMPGPARVGLSSVLPAVTGVSDVRLAVGAVASSATLDWCAALASSVWGDGTVTGVVRDYGIAGLQLEIASPLVASLTTSVNQTVTALSTAATALVGVNGLVSQALRTSILGALTHGLGLGSMTGTVTLTNLDLTGALGGLLTTPLTDGEVTVDLAGGVVRVDLARLLGDDIGGLNDLDPNHEVVLDATLLAGIAGRAGTLVDAWSGQVTTALLGAVRAATLTVNLAVNVTLLTLPVVGLTVTLTGSVASILAGTSTATVNGSLLGALPLGLSLTTLLTGVRTSVAGSVATTLTTQLTARVATLGATLAATSASLVTALGPVTRALPSVLSLRVNVQPDRPGAPPGVTADPGAPPWTSPAYSVAALRVGVVTALAPGGVAHTTFARSTVGPATLPD